MSYSTYYEGELEFSDKLSDEEKSALNAVFEGSCDFEESFGLPCTWRIRDQKNGTFLYVENQEDVFGVEDWLSILIERFFKPWGIEISGEVIWHGRGPGDAGVIFVHNNKVKMRGINDISDPFDDPSKTALERAARVLSGEIAQARMDVVDRSQDGLAQFPPDEYVSDLKMVKSFLECLASEEDFE